MSDEKEMSTVIDRVLDFIQRKGRTTITEVSVSLALNPGQVEHLVSILEESGMIKVKYALIDSGKTELISKQQAEVKDDDVDRLRQDVERIKNLGSMINKDIEKFESDYKAIERDISQWMVEADGTLKALQTKGGKDPASLKQAEDIERIAKDFELRISDSDQKVLTDVKSLQDKFKAFHKRVTEFKTFSGMSSGASPQKGAERPSGGFSIGGLFGKKN